MLRKPELTPSEEAASELLAAKFGLSISQMRYWSVIAKRLAVDHDSLNAAFLYFVRHQNMPDSANLHKEIKAAFNTVAAKEGTAARTAMAMDLFGRAGAAIMPIIVTLSR